MNSNLKHETIDCKSGLSTNPVGSTVYGREKSWTHTGGRFRYGGMRKSVVVRKTAVWRRLAVRRVRLGWGGPLSSGKPVSQ